MKIQIVFFLLVLCFVSVSSASGNYWVSNASISSGISISGQYQNVNEFSVGTQHHLIGSNLASDWYGYTWNGATWVSNSTVVNGLTDVGSNAICDVFEYGGNRFAIVGEADGVFNGYKWGGSSWSSNTTIVSGLPDVGDYSSPTVFYSGTSLFLISGNYNRDWYGYKWGGSSWSSNASIISGLGTTVEWMNIPRAFSDGTNLFLIVGDSQGAWTGYKRGSSSWSTNSTIVSGLSDVGTWPGHTIFDMGTNRYMLSGSYNAGVIGWKYNGTIIPPYTAPPLSISAYSPASGPTSYIGSAQNFSVTLNMSANSTWYVDGITRKTQSGTTTTYSNSSAPLGSHSVMCNSTDGDSSTSISWTWTVSDIPGLTVALLDQSSGSRITPASVTLFNTTYTNTGEINETGQYAFLSYIGMTDGEYILSATADGYYPAHGNVNLTLATDTEAYMYLVADDVNDSTALYERFRLIDNSHQYNLSDCQVRLDKVYDSGVATVFQSSFDYQGYAATWLSVTDQYMLYVICPDRTVTYGYFTPDPDGLVEIVITDSLPELWNEWLNYEISGDPDTGLISAVYESQKAIDVVDVWITYSENSTQAYHSNSTAANASFYFSGNTDYTYLVRMVAAAADGETLEVSQMITWDSGGVQPERLPMLPADAPDWLKNMLSIAFILLCVLVLGEIRYDLASIIGGLLTAFFWYTGNLKVEGGVVAVIAIIAVAAYMHRSRRE